MGYFQIRYDSRVIIYDCKAFIRLTPEANTSKVDMSSAHSQIFDQSRLVSV